MEKYLQILELHKIAEQVAGNALLEQNKKLLESMPILQDPEAIEHALSETDEAQILFQRMNRFPLYFTSDIGFLISGAQKGRVISVEELLEIGKFLDTVKANQVFLETLDSEAIATVYYREAVNGLIYPKPLNLRIKEIITPYGEIKDEASPSLKEIRKSIRDLEKNIQTKLQDLIAKNAAKLTQPLVSLRNDRYVIPVKNEMKNSLPGVIHDQSASGETVFIEPQAVMEMNNRLNREREAEKQEIYRILRSVTEALSELAEAMFADLDILLHLDFVFAKAQYAISIDAKIPKINTEGILELINCRHPLLHVEKVVPNTVEIGKTYQGIIITGPNTGGKTVLLKTVGLLSLMVKMGLPIPAEEGSNVMIFDNVFADIGDEQSIDQNLSTFSSHLKNVINIMQHVTDHSLVLLDELGSGTDPAEGSALAIAIFDYLLGKKCAVIATSHYSELKIHAFNSENIINASVEFDIRTLKPTYKLLLGVPGQSNALKISKILGLPEAILQHAEELAHQKNTTETNVLNKLIHQTHEYDRKLQQVNEKLRDLNRKLEQADSEQKQLQESKNEILHQAEEEAAAKIRKTSAKLEALMNELQEMKLREVKSHEIADIKHEIKVLKEEVHSEDESEELSEPAEPEIGQSVYVENFGAYGIIIKKNKNNKYDVQIGNATVTADQKHLKIVSGYKPEVPKKTTTAVTMKKSVPMTLDLRGFRYEDAAIEIAKYIDDAVYANLMQVNIIHGFGTGVIRELVQNFLKQCDQVESFRYGGVNEGGQGVTVVTLKNK